MKWSIGLAVTLALTAILAEALPVGIHVTTRSSVTISSRARERHLEIHGHRGARGEANEETLAAYADAFLAGATHLEWDVGITSDGVPVAWHDENILANKCLNPPGSDQDVVGRYIANLTLAQVKSLDCGSQRLGADFMLQQTRRRAKIQTLDQVFQFAACVDRGADDKIRFNIESKLSPPTPNTTVGPQEFVDKMYASFHKHGVLDRVVFQSFDWRTLQLMHAQHPNVTLSALVSSADPSYLSPIWLGGIDLDTQPGDTLAQRLVHAAKSIHATYLSPNHGQNGTVEVNQPGYRAFVDTDMVTAAHAAGLKVIPYTPDSLDTAEKLVYTDGVDGLITDYPTTFAAWARSRGFQLPRKRDVAHVKHCLKEARARDDEP